MNVGMGNGMDSGQRGNFISNRFTAFDRNNNDLIDADEAASEAERVFLLMDLDDDNELAEEEFMAMKRTR